MTQTLKQNVTARLIDQAVATCGQITEALDDDTD